MFTRARAQTIRKYIIFITFKFRRPLNSFNSFRMEAKRTREDKKTESFTKLLKCNLCNWLDILLKEHPEILFVFVYVYDYVLKINTDAINDDALTQQTKRRDKKQSKVKQKKKEKRKRQPNPSGVSAQLCFCIVCSVRDLLLFFCLFFSTFTL